MLLWGWRGIPDDGEHLNHEQASELLQHARASSNLGPEARKSFLENELRLLYRLDKAFDELAEKQSKRLVAAHERFSALMHKRHYQVVYPILPMDLMGMYILLPEGSA